MEMPNLTIELLTTPEQVAVHQERWNQLSGNRTQLRWEWLGSWADYYCHEQQLMVLVVRDEEEIIGFTPWYVTQSQLSGRTIRFLGDGKVGTDHMTLLIEQGREEDVVIEVADWLMAQRNNRNARWNDLEFSGVDHDDKIMRSLTLTMIDSGNRLNQADEVEYDDSELPDTMDEYIQQRSTSGKRKCRNIREWLENDRFRIVAPQTQDELQQQWDAFIDLHNKRRSDTGEAGWFEHYPYGEFLRDASSKLIESGLLRLTFVYYDGQPIAVQHALLSDDCWMYYQSGIQVSHGEFTLGQLVLYHTIEQRIKEGKQSVDMTPEGRPYKLRWHGEPNATSKIHLTAPLRFAIIHKSAWKLRRKLKSWAKQTVYSA